MNTTLLVGLFLSNLALVALVFALIRRLHTLESQFTSNLTAFMTSPDGKAPSPFAELVDKMGEVVAARVGSSVMAAIRGALGGTMKGVNAEALEEATEGSPGLALAASLAPKLFRKLGKNPAALAGLQGILGKFLGGDGTGLGSGAGNIVTRRHHE